MDDNTKIKRYYKSKLDEIPNFTLPTPLIQSAAVSTGIRSASTWETVFGLLVTIGYLIYFLNPHNWFSLSRTFIALMNGFSLSRIMWGFGIGF
jgi:hypothetical protein